MHGLDLLIAPQNNFSSEIIQVSFRNCYTVMSGISLHVTLSNVLRTLLVNFAYLSARQEMGPIFFLPAMTDILTWMYVFSR